VLNETYSKDSIGKYLSDKFPNQNVMKQGDSFHPLLFKFVLEYVIREIQQNKVGLKLNGTHRVLFCPDDLCLLGGYIYIYIP
jgi:hypothetical protein